MYYGMPSVILTFESAIMDERFYIFELLFTWISFLTEGSQLFCVNTYVFDIFQVI